MEREYTVIANTREDLPALEAEITASSGAGPIPSRSVDIANPRPGSKIQTHFMLTDEEAQELRSDPRVRAVEIPPDQRDDITIGLNATQSGTFYRASGLDGSYVNWGLRRCISETNNYVEAELGNTRITTIEGGYEYGIDGTGVDVVIQDSGIDPDHPDWNDYDGTSRLQQIDWYTASGLPGTQSADHYRDLDGHGSHCASIAAGLIYGWAKGAHIYSQKLSGLETLSGSDGTGIAISDAFDTIRLWHNAKTNGRPTVVNMSWGYGANITGNPTSGTYRGTAWTWGTDYTDRTTLMEQTGVSENFFGGGTSFRIPNRLATIDAEVDDMVADGIHVCIAAGNNLHKADLSTGPDYNNTVVFSGFTRSYHQGSSPFSDDAFMVGNVDSGAQTSSGSSDNSIVLDQTSVSTTRGPGVNIFAPGTDIMAATSRNYDTGSYSTTGYPGNATYPIMSIGGTSMASPQVAGVVAQHLQVRPNLTPAEMKTRMYNDAKAVLFTTGSDTDYRRIHDSLMGAPNRMLYSRYGKQAITVNTIDLLEAISVT
jgi:subtilisin family serine protease